MTFFGKKYGFKNSSYNLCIRYVISWDMIGAVLQMCNTVSKKFMNKIIYFIISSLKGGITYIAFDAQ